MGANEVFEAIQAFGEHEHRDLARGLDNLHIAGCDVSVMARLATVRAIRDVLLERLLLPVLAEATAAAGLAVRSGQVA